MTDKTGAYVTSIGDPTTWWKCLTCQWRVQSSQLPFACPRCGASRVKFMPEGAAPDGRRIARPDSPSARSGE